MPLETRGIAFCRLLQHLYKNKDGQDDACGGIQTHQRAGQTKQKTNDWQLCKPTNYDTADDLDDCIDDQRNDKVGYIGGLKCVREDFFDQIHNNFLLRLINAGFNPRDFQLRRAVIWADCRKYP